MGNIILFSIPFFLILMTIEVLCTLQKKTHFYELKDSLSNLGTGTLNQLASIISKPLSLYLYILVYNFWHLDQTDPVFTTDLKSAAGIFTWLFGFIAVDFIYWLFHKHSHEINILWASHVVHHSSEEYNLSVALRQTTFGFILQQPYIAIAALIGIPPEVYFTSYAINLIYQFWIHTRWIKKIGVFEILFNTPSHHRVHHARQTKYLDKNYAGVFIIWDKIFGTFIKEEEEPLYGIYPRFGSYNPAIANLAPFQELFHYFRKAKGLRHKWNVLFGGPMWLYENYKCVENIPIKRKNKMHKLPNYIIFLFALTIIVSLIVQILSPKIPAFWMGIILPALFGVFYLVGRLLDSNQTNFDNP